MLYTLTRPLTREPFGLPVWMQIATHTLIIPSAKYTTLNGVVEIRTRDLLSCWRLIPCQRNQLNQKFKLIVEAP